MKIYVRVKSKNDANTPIRGITEIDVPVRPASPENPKVANVSAAGQQDGKILNLTPNADYQISTDETTWVNRTTDADGVISNLAAGTYKVRTKATPTQFAGASASVTIGVGNVITIIPPTFPTVHTGYTQPDPMLIEIRNSSDQDVTLTSLSKTAGEKFIVQSIVNPSYTVPAGGSNTSFTVQPGEGWGVGEHTATITAEYGNGQTVSATVRFVVEPLPYEEDDDCKHSNLVKTEAKPATHLEAGNKEYWFCDDCNKYFGDEAGTKEITLESTVISKLTEHTAGDTGWHSDETNHWNICECGEVIDKEAHKFGEWTITKEATNRETGSRTKSCTVCGYKVTESIPATGTTEPTDPSKPTGPDKGNPDTGTTSPKSGDNSSFALWIALLLASGGAVTAAALYGRKRRKKE